uniref:Basic salivary proline-rich protein 4-like n=1 Tax=Camelus bactrianus TaxID=9837 RepID=A0A9W3GF54_CAMBA|nr:basic salivary proline-rich protein 4-like [Camelus bactrianus]XP_045377793.1 basic salivary proline-rich protein 4-like [Camelus bactrianus]XP_045377801.1 basic salivary proline-rich protein 4-like [Camelus bactrianus]XP_045377807.1 basic salivary proline-rich protein 4-like [Camelus bactrianus]
MEDNERDRDGRAKEGGGGGGTRGPGGRRGGGLLPSPPACDSCRAQEPDSLEAAKGRAPSFRAPGFAALVRPPPPSVIRAGGSPTPKARLRRRHACRAAPHSVSEQRCPGGTFKTAESLSKPVSAPGRKRQPGHWGGKRPSWHSLRSGGAPAWPQSGEGQEWPSHKGTQTASEAPHPRHQRTPGTSTSTPSPTPPPLALTHGQCPGSHWEPHPPRALENRDGPCEAGGPTALLSQVRKQLGRGVTLCIRRLDLSQLQGCEPQVCVWSKPVPPDPSLVTGPAQTRLQTAEKQQPSLSPLQSWTAVTAGGRAGLTPSSTALQEGPDPGCPTPGLWTATPLGGNK